MVGLPTINGVQRVAFLWHVGAGGATAVNVMHFSTASTDTLALKNAIDSNVSASMWAQTVSSASVYQLSITPLDGTSATVNYAVSGAKWTGSIAGTEYTPQNAMLVSLKTAMRGRQNRGRVFLPFISENAGGNGAVTASLATQQAAWDAFRTGMTTSLMPWHVASYGHGFKKSKGTGGTIIYTPVTWTPHSNVITSCQVESLFGTMRPRQSRLR